MKIVLKATLELFFKKTCKYYKPFAIVDNYTKKTKIFNEDFRWWIRIFKKQKKEREEKEESANIRHKIIITYIYQPIFY